MTLLGTAEETSTQGLDGLAERCAIFYEKGCRFAKWRCVLKVDVQGGCPSQLAIDENANVLARYASICQIGGLVPIVEPEVLMDGSHGLEEAISASTSIISAVYKKLHEHHVFLEGTLLKPSMVLPGQDCPRTYSVAEVAEATLAVLQRTVPTAVPGIAFLSGGQGEEAATAHLNAINVAAAAAGQGKKPWRISFSYARALQHSAVKAWAGQAANVAQAQAILLARAKANSLASQGLLPLPQTNQKQQQQQKEAMSESSAQESLYVKNYAY